MEYDLLIRGGTVVDGTRIPRFRADIGIKDGKIRRIGRIGDAKAGRVLDATGCIVAPGFIDVHTHYDAQIFWDPYCTISGWHGVTSVVMGNCGIGFAPVKANPATQARVMRMAERVEQIPFSSMEATLKWDWETFPEWLDALRQTPKGVNLMAYVSLSPLMVYVMGLEAAKSRPATAAEQKEMQRLLNEAMEAGALGFSLQRLGENSPQADFDGTPMPTDLMCDEDLLALGEVLRERDEGVIQIFQAYSGDPMYNSQEERDRDHAFLERLAEVSQRPILYSGIQVVDDGQDAHVRELAWTHDANERGLRIFGLGIALRFWFLFSLEDWNFYDTAPTWNKVCQGTVEEKMQKMSDPALRQKMRDEYEMLEPLGPGVMPGGLAVVRAPDHPELDKFIGCNVGELAQEKGIHPNDMMLDIALAGDLKVVFRSGVTGSGDAEKVGALMSDPFVVPGASDGGAHAKSLTGGSFTTDFLAWLVRDSGQMTLEDAHHHFSCLIARMAGLVDRGALTEGSAADVIVYDLAKLKRIPEWDFETVHDVPGNEWRRIQRAEGYRWTIVNGVVTFEDGKCTGATPGQVLAPGTSGAMIEKSPAPNDSSRAGSEAMNAGTRA